MNERVSQLAFAHMINENVLQAIIDDVIKDVDKIVDDLYHAIPLEYAAVLLTLDEQIKTHFYGECKFNYTIGFHWNNDNGQIGTCMNCNTDVFYGTMDEAKKMLDYFQNTSDNKDRQYKIFKVIEVNDEKSLR